MGFFDPLKRLIAGAGLTIGAVMVTAAALPVHVAGQGAASLPPEVLAYADTILTNGKVLTADKDFNIREAIALRDGKVLATGTTANIERMAGPKTQRINLAGKSVIPGIIDTHLHTWFGALNSHKKEISAIEPKFRDYADTANVTGASIDEVLQNIKKVADTRKPDTWVAIELKSPEMAEPLLDKVRRGDLDKVVPNHLLLFHVQGLYYLLNTKMIMAVKDFYGAMPEEYEIEPQTGLLAGVVDVVVVESMVADMLFEHPMQSIYPIFKDEMSRLAAFGITTDSGRLLGLWYQPVYREMDLRGELAVRIAYSAMGVTVNPNAADFYKRLGNITDMGTDHLWMAGAGVVHIDGSHPHLCTSLAPENPCMARNATDLKRKALFEAVKYGNRIVNTHVAGDLAADQLMDIVEEASKAGGITPAEMMAKGHTLDHCTLNPRPDQIERGKKLGVIWACAPGTLNGAEAIARDYGEEYANKWIAPAGGIIKAGGRVAGHGEGMRGDSYFTLLESLLTRKDSKGHVWGKDQAIDRKDMLRMYTNWAADYVARPDRLGSLEPGKFADLVVLDKDYMTLPIEEFHNLHADLTIVGGKTVWEYKPGMKRPGAAE